MASMAGREEEAEVEGVVEVEITSAPAAVVVLAVVVLRAAAVEEEEDEEDEEGAGAGGWSFLPPLRQAPVPLRSV